ncbi:helicase associated domain-containing protein [Streptomyces sp. NPDC007164]|uniref:helicase associated domain-containing protein n=1 Tax=Streptomyces sp. NPDC007164 TaxID=3156918 RepID=UPI00340BEB85
MGPAGFPLGTWPAGQRRFHKAGHLDPGRVKQLDGLGMVWSQHVSRASHLRTGNTPGAIAPSRRNRSTPGPDPSPPTPGVTCGGCGGVRPRSRLRGGRGPLP